MAESIIPNTLNEQIGSFILDNNSTYIEVGQTVSYNSSYTIPATGWWLLRVDGDDGNMGSWYLDSSRKLILCGNSNSRAVVYSPILLKKGTIIYTRNMSGTSYRVSGYYPL